MKKTINLRIVSGLKWQRRQRRAKLDIRPMKAGKRAKQRVKESRQAREREMESCLHSQIQKTRKASKKGLLY